MRLGDHIVAALLRVGRFAAKSARHAARETIAAVDVKSIDDNLASNGAESYRSRPADGKASLAKRELRCTD
jgi:histone H3/H4